MGKDICYEGVAMAPENDPAEQPAVSGKQWMRIMWKKITVEPFVFLCVASAVFKFVVLPQFLLDTICHRSFTASICSNIASPEHRAKQTEIQVDAAKWMLGLYACSLSISLFTVPLFGSLADVIGKKRVLYIPISFYTFQSIVYSVLSNKAGKLHPGYLIFCSVLGGLSGDIVALTMLACSYVSDITTEAERTFRLTLIDGVLNLSLCIFMFCSGYIIVSVGYSHVFLVSLGIDVLAFGCLFFFVPSDAVRLEKKPKRGDVVRTDKNESALHDTAVDGKGDSILDSNESTDTGRDFNGIQIETLINEEIFTTVTENAEEIQERGDAVISQPDDVEKKQEVEKEAKKIVSEAEPNRSEAEPNGCEVEKSESPGKTTDCESCKLGRFNWKLLLLECNPVNRFIRLRQLLREQGQTSSVYLYFFILSCASMAMVGESLTIVLYVTNQPFNMDSVNVGYLLSLQGLLRFVGGYSLLNVVFQHYFKWRDVNIVSLSFIVNIVYFVLFGVADTRKMLYSIQVLSVFGPLAGPTLRSIISKKGDPTSHATILSIALTMDTLASFLVNILVNSTYAIMVKLYSGAFSFVLVGISLLGFVLSFAVRRYDVTTLDDNDDTSSDKVDEA
eukprot:gene7828-8678_t